MEVNNQKCLDIINQLRLKPRIVAHEPILNYETALRVDRELNLTGHETKSLFLKGKSGRYYIFITLMENRMDSKLLKSLLGEKISLVPDAEMIELTGMQPGCMTPFGLKDDLISAIVVDPAIYQEEKLILAFGTERMSMEILPSEVATLLKYCYERIIPLES